MAINFPINPSNGDTYVVGEVTFTYNSTKSIWSSEIITDTLSLSLSDITNVSSTSPTEGQVLSYDVTNTEWINTTPIDAYTKTEVDTAIGNVSVDLSGYDTSVQVDTKIAAIPDTDLSAYDTSAQVDTKVAGIIDSAPSTLNTLNELAAALGDDANHVTTMTTLVGTKADQSTTYTKTEVDTEISNVSVDLSAYDTSAQVDTKISNAASGGGASVVISDTAPSSPSAGDLWTNSSTMALNIFYVDSDSSQWVELNQTEIDLAGVYTSDQVDTKIDEIPIKKLPDVPTVLNVSSVLDSFDLVMDSCKYIVKVKSDTDKYITEILLLHNGVDAFITEYGIIDTSTDWVTLSSSIVGSNVELSIITTDNATVELTKII